MNLAGMPDAGIQKMHSAVREALEIDDQLQSFDLNPVYGVRPFPDRKTWSDQLEAELDRRSIKYPKVAW